MTNECRDNRFEKIKSLLYDAACENMVNKNLAVTVEGHFIFLLISAIISQAIIDLDNIYKIHRISAKEYFDSLIFKRHCDLLNIEASTILYIVENRTNFRKVIGKYDEYELEDDI